MVSHSWKYVALCYAKMKKFSLSNYWRYHKYLLKYLKKQQFSDTYVWNSYSINSISKFFGNNLFILTQIINNLLFSLNFIYFFLSTCFFQQKCVSKVVKSQRWWCTGYSVRNWEMDGVYFLLIIENNHVKLDQIESKLMGID